MIDNDPCDEWPVFLRWVPEPWFGERPSRYEMYVPGVNDSFWVEPPRNLGKFNCRGEYVVARSRSASSSGTAPTRR